MSARRSSIEAQTPMPHLSTRGDSKMAEREATHPSLHAQPAFARVLANQAALYRFHKPRARAIWLGVILLQVALLAAAGILIGITIQVGDGDTRILFSDVSDLGLGEAVAAVVAASALASLWGFFAPYAWPSERRYPWTLPVDRRRHDLARATIGGGVTLALSTLALLLALAVAALFGHLGQLAVFGPLAWLNLWLAPLLFFSFSVADPTRKERSKAVYWIAEAGSTLFLLLVTGPGFLSWASIKALLFEGPLSGLNAIMGGFGNVLFDTDFFYPERWLEAFALWVGVHLVAFLIVVRRRH